MMCNTKKKKSVRKILSSNSKLKRDFSIVSLCIVCLSDIPEEKIIGSFHIYAFVLRI